MQAAAGVDNRCVMAGLELLRSSRGSVQSQRHTPVVLLQLVSLCLLQVVFPQHSIRDG